MQGSAAHAALSRRAGTTLALAATTVVLFLGLSAAGAAADNGAGGAVDQPKQPRPPVPATVDVPGPSTPSTADGSGGVDGLVHVVASALVAHDADRGGPPPWAPAHGHDKPHGRGQPHGHGHGHGHGHDDDDDVVVVPGGSPAGEPTPVPGDPVEPTPEPAPEPAPEPVEPSPSTAPGGETLTPVAVTPLPAAPAEVPGAAGDGGDGGAAPPAAVAPSVPELDLEPPLAPFGDARLVAGDPLELGSLDLDGRAVQTWFWAALPIGLLGGLGLVGVGILTARASRPRLQL